MAPQLFPSLALACFVNNGEVRYLPSILGPASAKILTGFY